ncbi:M48 family metallopeptidase [bacterium AH-315-K20]|nr:M48 family metallopeptidase [bacterium AH-315-K20]
MITTLALDDIELKVVYKDIKNVHLSVHPPTGRVTISAPTRTSAEALRAFAISKLAWIRRQQRTLQRQDREPPREYIDRESHYLWGQRYLLTVEEHDTVPGIECDHRRIVMRVRPGAEAAVRGALMARWYRDQIRAEAPEMIARWEPVLGVKLERFSVRQMKTMWGSCSSALGTIRLNTELAKKPRECLEYIIVHELIHLREPTHNQRFITLIEDAMPQWRSRRDQLNELPVRHDEWRY